MIKEHRGGFVEIHIDGRGLLLTQEEYRAAARRWNVTQKTRADKAMAATDEKSEAE